MGKNKEKKTKISEMNLEELNTYLKKLEQELEDLEVEADKAYEMDSYYGGKPFSYGEIMGYDRYASGVEHSHSRSLMMSHGDYVALDISDKKKEISKVKAQIEKLANMCPGGNG